MKERPILMSAPMVCALQDGRKTQTRRIIKNQPIPNHRGKFKFTQFSDDEGIESYWHIDPFWTVRCPYGKPGDILLIKESAWMWCERVPNGLTKTGKVKWNYVPDRSKSIFYVADHPNKPEIQFVSPDTGNQWGWRFKVGRFLPSWAIRIKRVITDVRVERLQDINGLDAMAEGLKDLGIEGARWHWDATVKQGHFSPWRAYRALWEYINGAGSWDANPYVWCISFKRIEP